jgi:hypothetical protein
MYTCIYVHIYTIRECEICADTHKNWEYIYVYIYIYIYKYIWNTYQYIYDKFVFTYKQVNTLMNVHLNVYICYALSYYDDVWCIILVL